MKSNCGILLLLTIVMTLVLSSCVPTPEEHQEDESDQLIVEATPTALSSSNYPEIYRQLPSTGYIAQANNGGRAHIIYIYNLLSISYTTRWYIDNTEIPSSEGDLSLVIYPSELGIGTHQISVAVTDPTKSVTYDSTDWQVIVNEISVNLTASPSTYSTITVIDGEIVGTEYWKVSPDTGIDPEITVAGFTTSGTTTVKFYFDDDQDPIGEATYYSAPIKLSDIDSNFSYPLPNSNIGEMHTISVKVFEERTSVNQVGETKTWNIYVRPRNTKPTLISDSSGGGPASGPYTMVQNVSTTFKITPSDDDTPVDELTIVYKMDGVELEEGNPIRGIAFTGIKTDETLIPGDCKGLDIVSCQITLRSYDEPDGGPPVPVEASDRTLTVEVYDKETYGAPPAYSIPLTWNLSTTEEQSAISLNGITTGSGLNIATNTFIYLDDNTVSIAAANEGETIHFNLVVSDQDRDNYKIELLIDMDANGAEYDYESIDINGEAEGNNIIRTRTDTALMDVYTVNYTIPEKFTPQVSQIVNIKMIVTDIPDKETPTEDIWEVNDFAITNYNPLPIWDDSSELPSSISFDNITMVGFPFTIDPGEDSITDSSDPEDDPDGAEITYKWRVDVDCDGSYYTISNATSSPILVWTPSPGLDGKRVCFKLCLGDNGMGSGGNPTSNSVDNCPAHAGPWLGLEDTPFDYFLTVFDSEKDISDSSYNEVSNILISGTSTTLYTVYTNGTSSINIVETALITESASSTAIGSFATLDTGLTAREPRNISAVKSGNKLLIAYTITENGTGDDLDNVSKVIRVDTSDLSTIEYEYLISYNSGHPDYPDSKRSIGRIITDNGNWYLPFIDSENTYNISVARQSISVNAVPLIEQLPSSDNSTQVSNAHDVDNNKLVILGKNYYGGGDWTIQSYELSDLQLAVADTKVLTVFENGSITDAWINIGGAQNKYVYVAGINTGTSNSLALASFENDHAGSINYESSKELIQSIPGTIPAAKYIQLAAGADTSTKQDVIISLFNDDTSASNNDQIFMVTIDVPAIGVSAITSENINLSYNITPTSNMARCGDTSPCKKATENLFFMTPVLPDYNAGTDGAEEDESIKNIILVTYEQSDSKIKTVLVNTNEEEIGALEEGYSGVIIHGFHPGYFKKPEEEP